MLARGGRCLSVPPLWGGGPTFPVLPGACRAPVWVPAVVFFLLRVRPAVLPAVRARAVLALAVVCLAVHARPFSPKVRGRSGVLAVRRGWWLGGCPLPARPPTLCVFRRLVRRLWPPLVGVAWVPADRRRALTSPAAARRLAAPHPQEVMPSKAPPPPTTARRGRWLAAAAAAAVGAGGGQLRRACRRAPVLRLLARLPGLALSPPPCKVLMLFQGAARTATAARAARAARAAKVARFQEPRQMTRWWRTALVVMSGSVRFVLVLLGVLHSAMRSRAAAGLRRLRVGRGAMRSRATPEATRVLPAGGPAAPEGTTVVRREG